MNTNNIFTYARSRVDNKSIFARIGHSSKLHSFRSAVSSPGSFASKGLGLVTSVGRAGLSLIPVPIVGDLLSAAQSAVEGAVRSKLHERRLSAARGGALNLRDEVKFSLKELSIEEFDRYRWKLHDAMTQLEIAKNKYNAQALESERKGKTCDALLEVALALEQAQRRYDRLHALCQEMISVMQKAVQWCEQAQTSINATREDFAQNHFAAQVQRDILPAYTAQSHARHAECGDYCFMNKPDGVADNWTAVKDNLALLARVVSAPVELDSFISLDGSAFEVDS